MRWAEEQEYKVGGQIDRERVKRENEKGGKKDLQNGKDIVGAKKYDLLAIFFAFYRKNNQVRARWKSRPHPALFHESLDWPFTNQE